MVPAYSTKTLYILRERIHQHLLNNSLIFKDTCTFFALFSTLSSMLINFKGWWGPQLYSFCESAAQSFIIATAKNVAAVHLTNHMENKANRADYKTNFFQCQQTDGDYHPCQKVHPDFKTATLSQC